MKPVLVIDDEAIVRHLICSFLEKAGIESVSAEDGEAGLKLFAEFKPEIVITDIRMPKIDGIEVLKRIKKIKPETEVIVITGHGEIELAIESLQMDASDFIQKPFQMGAFLVAFRRAQNKINLRETLAQTQIQLLQLEKMASLGQLAAGVAHEINNPISFVNSNLGTFKKYLERILNTWHQLEEMLRDNGNEENLKGYEQLKRKNKLDFILKDIESVIDESLEGIRRVKQIVQDLKEYSRIDSNELEECNINDCVNSTLNIIWNEIKYNCQVEKKLGELPPVLCFPQQINQVIMNLLINASQAIEDEGRITITTKPEDGGVRLEISDNGKGIPNDIIDRIFDPFFTTKEVGKGTGLGLNIVYNIINKHGGDIEVKSAPGEGTTFSIRLPDNPPIGNKTRNFTGKMP